ncbi:MAG TPA: CoA transferase [Longimicrobiales bacterium]|nr:CoA transferase [Longimicrobiales bacterium]
METALAGVRVVDLSENLAGPYCGQILADLGAQVVKVERPVEGDPARAWGAPAWGRAAPLFLAANRSKRSVCLDLKSEEGRRALEALLAGSDVLVQSFRAGVMEKLGFGYDDVAVRHPRLLYCSIAAYGASGPLAALPGYDPLMQAHAGLLSVTGHPGEPARVGTSLVDMGTGLWAALHVLAALRQREATGRGTHIVASLFECALSWSAYHLLGYLATGDVPGPAGTGFPLIAPYDAFPTADGRLMIAAANDGLFRRLCDLLGLDALAADPRFADNPSRAAHRDALNGAIATATARWSTGALTAALRDAGVPCAPILDMAGVAAEPQTRASGMLQETPAHAAEAMVTLGPPVTVGGERAAPAAPPPLRGEHTAEVLRELGWEAEAARALARRWGDGR